MLSNGPRQHSRRMRGVRLCGHRNMERLIWGRLHVGGRRNEVSSPRVPGSLLVPAEALGVFGDEVEFDIDCVPGAKVAEVGFAAGGGDQPDAK